MPSPKLIRQLAAFCGVFFFLCAANGRAQVLTQSGSFSAYGYVTESGNSTPLEIQQYTGSAPLEEAILRLTVTSVSNTGEWDGISQTAGVPIATLVDSVNFENMTASTLVETDNFTGTATLAEGQTNHYTISSFTPLPNSVTLDITGSDLRYFESGSIFPSLISSSMVENPQFGYPVDNQYTLSGEYSLQYIVPEPNSAALTLGGLAALLGCSVLARRSTRTAAAASSIPSL